MQQNNLSNGQIPQAISDATEAGFDPRYLAAKKDVDDRALNHYVWETLRQVLPQTTCSGPINILEIGAGIGTMLERVIDRGLLTGPATYVVTDSDPGQLSAAQAYLSQWAGRRGHTLSWFGTHSGRLSTARTDVSLVLIHTRAEDLMERSDLPDLFHLLIAHAVLDLVDFPAVLPQLFSQLKNDGLAYLTCNFDGETVFLPKCDGDEEIVRLYHSSMEARLPGASHTGRRLLTFLQGPGLEILAAGSSDWIIHPRQTGYSKEETFFLHAIIETVERELAKKNNPPSSLAAWARLRHLQVEAGELSFLARHLDLLARRLPLLP
jgi:hypothetical protein